MLSSVSFLGWAASVEGAITFQNLMVSVELYSLISMEEYLVCQGTQEGVILFVDSFVG